MASVMGLKMEERGRGRRAFWLFLALSWLPMAADLALASTYSDEKVKNIDLETRGSAARWNHNGASSGKLTFSHSKMKGSRETGTERYPWQNPWYKDYGKFRKNNDPVFDNNMVTNVTAQLGGTAFLHCRVKNLAERPVSWVRRRDWHILTSGMLTYTNDERFQVIHTEGGDNWTLQIKYVQKRDNGTYECQVATGGGTMSHYFNLHIVIPEAFILGSGEYHIEQGSTISLVCIIENSPAAPQYVFWYHNDRMINYDTSRGGVTVNTEPGPKTHSRLIINNANYSDSGNYSCRASNTEPANIYVFVSEGDKTAAIQRQEPSLAVTQHLPLHTWCVLWAISVWVMR